MIQVVCWKWDGGVHVKKGIQFTADHVNRLKNMVARHLHIPYEFCCITDNPEGIDKDVRIINLWKDHRDMGGCYVRLRAFSRQMEEIIGNRFIWLDLDTVILGDITPIVDRKEDFVIWGDTHPLTPYNDSMVMMNAGCREEVWRAFDPRVSPRAARKMGYVGTDQAWIGACLGRNEARWSIYDGVYSYRCHVKKYGLDGAARIVFFHGEADPSQPELQARHPWIKQHWQ